MLADAPIGVVFPPRLAPINKPNKNKLGLMANLSAREIVKGSIATKKGTLSIKADKITDAKTIVV